MEGLGIGVVAGEWVGSVEAAIGWVVVPGSVVGMLGVIIPLFAGVEVICCGWAGCRWVAAEHIAVAVVTVGVGHDRVATAVQRLIDQLPRGAVAIVQQILRIIVGPGVRCIVIGGFSLPDHVIADNVGDSRHIIILVDGRLLKHLCVTSVIRWIDQVGIICCARTIDDGLGDPDPVGIVDKGSTKCYAIGQAAERVRQPDQEVITIDQSGAEDPAPCLTVEFPPSLTLKRLLNGSKFLDRQGQRTYLGLTHDDSTIGTHCA